MRIPSKGRFAVSAMLDLALHQQQRPLTIAEIAEKQNISLSYLEQLFANLRASGLVHGTRGPGGGYKLARSPDQINVAQIIESIDDITDRAPEAQPDYVPAQLWNDLSGQLNDFLVNISLADCINKARTSEHC